MTQAEAGEFFRYVDAYQEKNDTSVVPDEAYDYIQYIAEQLDVSQNQEITDALRAEAGTACGDTAPRHAKEAADPQHPRRKKRLSVPLQEKKNNRFGRS